MGHQWVNALTGAWFNGYVPTASDFQALDNLLVGAMNGDGGGTYGPSADIAIAGAGLWLAGPSFLESAAVMNAAGANAMTLGDSDYPLLVNSHTGATRNLATSCLPGVSSFGFVAFIGTSVAQLSSVCTGARTVIPLRVHQGATLSQAVLSFQIGSSHTAVPASLPGFRVCQRDQYGTVTPLGSGDVNGFVYPATPASGTAWYAANAAQTLTYTCAAGVVVDRTAYDYFAEIIDEGGVGSIIGNLYNDITCTFTSIADARPS